MLVNLNKIKMRAFGVLILLPLEHRTWMSRKRKFLSLAEMWSFKAVATRHQDPVTRIQSPWGTVAVVMGTVNHHVWTKAHFFRCVWNEQVYLHHKIKHCSQQITLSTAALLAIITLLLINHYFAVYCTSYECNWFRLDMWSLAKYTFGYY